MKTEQVKTLKVNLGVLTSFYRNFNWRKLKRK